MHCSGMYGCTVPKSVINGLKVNKQKVCVVFLTRGVVEKQNSCKVSAVTFEVFLCHISSGSGQSRLI